MAQIDHQAHWIITENIVRFQVQLKSETDTCRRKLLEGLLVLEREKLRTNSSSPRTSFDATAGKVPGHDQAEKEQDDGSPQGF